MAVAGGPYNVLAADVVAQARWPVLNTFNATVRNKPIALLKRTSRMRLCSLSQASVTSITIDYLNLLSPRWTDSTQRQCAAMWCNLPRGAMWCELGCVTQVPLWDVHKTGECTHWCSPSAYHVWVFLFNALLRDEGIGNQVPPDQTFPTI